MLNLCQSFTLNRYIKEGSKYFETSKWSSSFYLISKLYGHMIMLVIKYFCYHLWSNLGSNCNNSFYNQRKKCRNRYVNSWSNKQYIDPKHSWQHCPRDSPMSTDVIPIITNYVVAPIICLIERNGAIKQ